VADPVDTSGDEKQHHPWDGGPRVLHGPLTEDEQRIEAERATSLAAKEAEAKQGREELAAAIAANELTEEGNKLTKEANRLTSRYVQMTLGIALFSALGTGAAWYQGHVAKIAADAAELAAETASKTLEEMKTESLRTLNANKEAMMLDQRPWLGLTQLKINHLADGTTEQEGSAINSGRTPARKVQAAWGFTRIRVLTYPSMETSNSLPTS
jgi:hypothetical protein